MKDINELKKQIKRLRIEANSNRNDGWTQAGALKQLVELEDKLKSMEDK